MQSSVIKYNLPVSAGHHHKTKHKDRSLHMSLPYQ